MMSVSFQVLQVRLIFKALLVNIISEKEDSLAGALALLAHLFPYFERICRGLTSSGTSARIAQKDKAFVRTGGT